jgi:anaerobic selenocysteine-containing dehydrogenase
MCIGRGAAVRGYRKALSPRESDVVQLYAAEGDLVDVVSPRGRIRACLRVSSVRLGTVFVPFHYGYWDTTGIGPAEGELGRAANDLTITGWDPVSKQPLFKTCASPART